ncbi:hypothetical protein L083_5038 [Actinoplanes sp. N902-109]|nr:hypothetical protein L083_5038 [Actinoplanes sp. N902-109]
MIMPRLAGPRRCPAVPPRGPPAAGEVDVRRRTRTVQFR